MQLHTVKGNLVDKSKKDNALIKNILFQMLSKGERSNNVCSSNTLQKEYNKKMSSEHLVAGSSDLKGRW